VAGNALPIGVSALLRTVNISQAVQDNVALARISQQPYLCPNSGSHKRGAGWGERRCTPLDHGRSVGGRSL